MTTAQPPFNLEAAAAECLRAHGFDPQLPADAASDAAALAAHPPAVAPGQAIRDLRALLWSSIDNDTSRDLDQIEVAERLQGGHVRMRVGIADVDALVPKGSAMDRHAAAQTTTLYTGVKNFPMLPEPLSTGLTSLLVDQDRLAIVIEFDVSSSGEIGAADIYRAVVRNRAQLAYSSVGAWLEGVGPAPPAVAASTDLQDQLRLQDTCAQALGADRSRHGALEIESLETEPVIVNGQVTGIVASAKNHATDLIENLMIAANGVVARFLEAARVSSIRRVVKTPERWNRIVEVATAAGGHLPPAPDSKALNEFLVARHAADPDHFADLSLAVVKLMGPGEYVLERPGETSPGHFGLAVEDYTHSTAPNRRFADVVTQRVLKAVLAHAPAPYTDDELAAIAAACTARADAARKVEREMTKRIAAVAMARRIGEVFDAIVTGVTPRGTFVRVLHPHVEGLLVRGHEGIDVGDRLRVTLVSTDPQRGFIDFARA